MKTMLEALMEEIHVERKRQMEEEGFSRHHDDTHTGGELALAAICYASPIEIYNEDEEGIWPFDHKWWKPKDRRSNLIRAAALLVAEIERLDRDGEGRC